MGAAPVLVALGLAACGAAPADPSTSPSSASGSPVAASSAPTASSPAPITSPSRGEAPTSIGIPAIDIDSRVQPVGAPDRVLEIPAKPWVVGWWRDGVGAGSDAGTAVLVAHLDSREYGVGPFARATDLRRGDRMTLTAGAAELTYEVAAVETFLKERLPYERLFDQSGPPRVVLVTCGGEYRRDAGGWDSNVVVTFTPV